MDLFYIQKLTHIGFYQTFLSHEIQFGRKGEKVCATFSTSSKNFDATLLETIIQMTY